MSHKQFDMTSKFTERNVWVFFSRLVDDLSPYLPAVDLDPLRRAIRSRDVDGLMSAVESFDIQSILSSEGTDSWRARHLYLVGSVLRKYQFKGGEENRREAALDSFLKTEVLCAEYNRTTYKELSWSDSQDVTNAFTFAREFISRVLGSVLPSFDVLTKDARHGPGSTLATRRGKVTSYYKYSEWPYSVTRGALPYAIALLESDERWLGALQDSYRERFGIPKHFTIDTVAFRKEVFEIVEGNKICFVPKDVRKDRPIAIEPTMNLMLQLGVDGYIRSRLKRWGIDLDDQSMNQSLAKEGSMQRDLKRSYATLDLSSASDSVSLRLCELLLPPEWYRYLCALRSPQGHVEGIDSPIVYEKISSMGNGYTFALESLIFTALVHGSYRAMGRFPQIGEHSVFGDDIIVSSDIALFVTEVLSVSGFTLNLEKSFVFGRFRESCGKDYVDGTNVRPVFWTDPVEFVDELIHYRNSLYLYFRDAFYPGYVSSAVEYLTMLVPPHHRLFGPVLETTNTHLFSENPRVHHGNYEFRRITRVPRKWNPQDFLWRKLMHDLRDPYPSHHCASQRLWKDPDRSVTSRFEVTRRKAFDFVVSSTRVPAWCVSN